MSETPSIDYRELKSRAMMKQKIGDFFSVRLAVTGGYVTADHLAAVAEIARKHGRGSVHLTTRQGIEIPNVPYENLEPLQRDLQAAGLSLGFAGPRVRGITACPSDVCQHGLIDAQHLARVLQASVGQRAGLPHKFKIGITGCPNSCAKPMENDLGVMGMAKGYRVFVGGRMGKTTRIGDRLPFVVRSEQELIAIIEAALAWYCEHADGRERFGATISRVGLDSLLEKLQPLAA